MMVFQHLYTLHGSACRDLELVGTLASDLTEQDPAQACRIDFFYSIHSGYPTR